MKTSSIARLSTLLALGLAAVPQAHAIYGPGSNAFAGATMIEGGNDYSDATNLTAFTFQGGEEPHTPTGDGGAKKSAWWTWTAPSNGYCTVDTVRTSSLDNAVWDTLIAVYTGDFVNDLTRVAVNDDWSTDGIESNPRLSSVTFYATEGVTYRIAVDAFNAQQITASRFNVAMQLRHLALKKTSRAAVILAEISPATGAGMVTATTTSTGGISGKLALGTKSYSFAGIFNVNGYFQASFPQKGPGNIPAPPITLIIDGTGDGAVQVTLGNGSTNGSAFPEKMVFTKQNPAPVAGTYPSFMDNSAEGDPVVGGEGILTVKISPTGTVTATGFAADGVPVTFSSALYKKSTGNAAEIIAYRSLLAGRAAFLLDAQVHLNGNVGEIHSGFGAYLRSVPVSPADLFYPQGITTAFELVGSTFKKPAAGQRALTFLNGSLGDGFLKVVNSGGELKNGDLIEGLNLTTANKFIFVSAMRKPALALNTTTGVITGSITEPGEKKRTIRAVLTLDAGVPVLRGHATGAKRNVFVQVTP